MRGKMETKTEQKSPSEARDKTQQRQWSLYPNSMWELPHRPAPAGLEIDIIPTVTESLAPTFLPKAFKPSRLTNIFRSNLYLDGVRHEM